MNWVINLKFLIYRFLHLHYKYKKLAAQTVWDMSDVYLISYPKSGTTWLCLIIANILEKINRGYRRVDLFTVHDYIPDMHANPERILQLQPPRIIKSHENFDVWYRRIHIRGQNIVFPRVIYLVRDGRDAMTSYYQYVKALQGYNATFSNFIYDKKKSGGDWVNHVRKWVVQNKQLDRREFLLLKYEDLQANTLEEIKKVTHFIGIEANDGTLEAAINCARIENIRNLEKKYGGGVRYKYASYKFARKGLRRNIDNNLKATSDLYFIRNMEIFGSLGYK